MENKVQPLFSGDLSPRLMSAIERFDDAVLQAIEKAYVDNIPQAFVVALLHGYAQQQTQVMLVVDDED
jgi:hypothetical protein